VKQGQSESTRFKELRFDGLLRRNINAVNGISSRIPFDGYLHVDLNCGSGWNEAQDAPGSPVVFLNAVKAADFPWFALFVDHNKEAISKLMANLGHPECVHYIHGDNAAFAAALPSVVQHFLGWDPTRTFGSILSDPNDTSHPLSALSTLNAELPKVDCIMSFAANQYKRARGVHGDKWANPLTRVRKTVAKSKWQIGTPIGRDQWTVLFGSNYDGWREHAAKGIFDCDSPKGQMLLRLLETTGCKWKSHTQITLNI